MLKKIVLFVIVVIFLLLAYQMSRDNVTYVDVDGFSKEEQELNEKYGDKKYYSAEDLDKMEEDVRALILKKVEKLKQEESNQ